jgi:tetratricopeptide (TPR) repeat protein
MADTLLIVHVESPQPGREGDTLYRTVQPCRALGEQPNIAVLSGSWLAPEVRRLSRTADVLVLCMAAEPDLLPVVARRRMGGRFTVYELNDDVLSPQPWNPVAHLARNPILRSLFSRLAALSHAIQFSTAALAGPYGRLGTRQAVFKNHLWEAPPEPAKPARLRVGWGGSVGHREDLQAALPAIRAALDRHGEAELAVMASPSFRDLLAGFPPERLHFVPSGGLFDYYHFVASLHVGLCPLLDSDWNRCRSDVKWLEYAAHRVAPLCADLTPYADVRDGETGLLYRTLEELTARLDRLLLDSDLRRRIADGAAREARTQRLERRHVSDRLAFYARAAEAAGCTFAPGLHPELAAAALGEGMAEDFPGSRYHRADGGEAGRLLYRGLVLARDGHPAEARRCFAEATRLDPGSYLAWLYAGNAEPDSSRAIQLLIRATEIAPESVSASYLLGSRLLAAGDKKAMAELQRCARLAPAFGAAQALLGERALAAGDEATGRRLLLEALNENPWLPTPAAALAQAEFAAGRPEAALGPLLKALAADDRFWETQYLAGRALLAAGHAADACPLLEAALERADNRVPVLEQLARAKVALGRLDEARRLIEELKRITQPG